MNNDQRFLLHVLRNPHGYNEDVRKGIAVKAADEIERLLKVERAWMDAYENMREFAEKNGLDTITRG